MNRDHIDRILEFLKKKRYEGATITELVKTLHLTRDNIRIALAALEGADKVIERTVGKAKLYRIKE